MGFKIIVDNSYDLPKEYVEKNDLGVVYLPFHLNDKTYENTIWDQISAEEFYNALGNGGTAGTALVNHETFVKVYTEYAEKDEELLVVLLSGGLSGTAQNAMTALAEVKEKYPDCKIYPVDSISAAGGTGLIAMLAVEKRAEGLSAKETAQWLEEKKHSCLALFTVDDLMYLHRGGRLSKVSAVAGSIIGIKPLLNVSPDGYLKLKDKARGRKGALETLVRQMKRTINDGRKVEKVIISHSDCLEDAEKIAGLIKESMNIGDIYIEMMGPVIGAHVGPGCLAVFFEADMDRKTYEAKFYPEK